VLDQLGCLYTPHVIGLQVGQTLEVRNSDPTTHNVHFFAERSPNPSENHNQPAGAAALETRFEKSEIGARVGCDIHPWMSAWISAVDHPFFAVSGADGSFAIRGLPAGEYEFEAWHELFGRVRASATVAASETRELELVFRK
jgi:hypothetical protein